MHCVICGLLLTNENQMGLVCVLCRRDPQDLRKSGEQVITVRYCSRCGRPYQPADASIQHESCSLADGETTVPGTTLKSVPIPLSDA